MFLVVFGIVLKLVLMVVGRASLGCPNYTLKINKKFEISNWERGEIKGFVG